MQDSDKPGEACLIDALMVSPDLSLREDDLDGVRVVGIGYGVGHDAVGSHYAAGLQHLVREIRRVPNHILGLGRLPFTFYACKYCSGSVLKIMDHGNVR